MTSPNIRHARSLSRKIVKSKLAACVQLLPKIESCYYWNGKLETSTEILLLIKTDNRKFLQLEKFVRKNHPYDVPEIVEVSVRNASKAYANWLKNSLR